MNPLALFHMAVDKLLILEVRRKTGYKNFEVNMKWYFQTIVL